MSNINDASGGDYLAQARQNLKAAIPTANPLKAGWQAGKAQWNYDGRKAMDDLRAAHKELKAPWTLSIEMPKTAPCPACNKTISTITSTCPNCAEPLNDKKWAQSIGERYSKRFRRFGLIAAVIGAFVAYEKTRTVSPEEIAAKQALEAEVAAELACERRVSHSLVNSGSFDGVGSYHVRHMSKTVPGSTEIKVARNFTATNGFGATLDHRYFCTYDAVTKRVTDVVTEQGFR